MWTLIYLAGQYGVILQLTMVEAGAFAALISAVELHGLNIKAERGPAWVPGDFGTARIAEPGTEQFASLASGETWNGRPSR